MGENKQEKDNNLRTYQIMIKPGHRLYEYFDNMCFLSKNLYNITNFYIRQIYTGISKCPADREKNEVEAIELINAQVMPLNKIKLDYYCKRLENEERRNSNKEVKKPNEFKVLSKEHPFLSYELLEGVFKLIDQDDYRALPSHSNQLIMKQAFGDWDSFFCALREYNINPGKFNNRPKLPGYAKKNGRKIAFFSNQTCIIKEDKYLKFPGTKEILNIGKVGAKGILKQIRVVPRLGVYIIEVVMCLPEGNANNMSLVPDRIAGIDLGVNNFVTMVNNADQRPVIVKGNVIKAINQFYNKLRSGYYSKLQKGNNPVESQKTSKRLLGLTLKRNNRIKDYMHKVSRLITSYCIIDRIDTVVIGKNKQDKNKINIGGVNNQNFVQIPHALFVKMLTYKLEEQGIRVIVTEESYTSKASFLDMDDIPVYKEECETDYRFSGKRIHRGLYKSRDGILLNADINGAYNIIRKVIPQAFAEVNAKVPAGFFDNSSSDS